MFGAAVIAVAGYLIGSASVEAEDSTSAGDRVQSSIPQLEQYVHEAMDRKDVPAVAIGVVADDELVYARGFGTGEAGQEVGPDTMFEIGSATKSFLGATLAILVDRGLIDWNDRVIDHFPGFRLNDPWVTREFRIADLLAQRTGMAPYAADVLSLLGYGPDASLAAFASLDPVSSFRTEFAYQNVPHLVASQIVAEKTGRPDWNAAVPGLLLEPLGMSASGTSASTLTEAEDSTRGHQVRDGELRQVEPVSLPEGVYGAGSIVSNVTDMANWLRFQLGRGTIADREVLSRGQHARTWQPRVTVTGDFAQRMEQVPGATQLSYATGWFVHSVPEGRIIEHGGTTLGYTSAVRLDPDRNLGIVVLTNQAHDGGIAIPISKFAFDLFHGREPLDPLTAAEPAADQEQAPPEPDAAARKKLALELAGTYAHPVAGTVRLTERDGTLRTRVGPKRIQAVLELGGFPFELSWRVDNREDGPVMSAPVTASREGGRISGITIADLDFERQD